MAAREPAPELSLHRLLSPEVLADPYPLYRRLRAERPVYFDPYLHTWVVTGYDDVAAVLTRMSAVRTPPPDRLRALGMGEMAPLAEVMVRQMLFVDPPEHTRLRARFAAAFTPRRVDRLGAHIVDIADRLLAEAAGRPSFDVIGDFAAVLSAIVTAELMGLPTADHPVLKTWSETFAEVLGNFQHNPDRAEALVRALAEMTDYFRAAVRDRTRTTGDGLVDALVTGDQDLTEEETVANLVLTMVGGQETTTNLIGNGVLTLMRHPAERRRLRADPALLPAAVEELLRFESPSQHTARIATEDTEMGGELIRRGQAVIAVMGSANRDETQFPDPDRLDLGRAGNRHLAFGWAAHFCFGAVLARMEGLIGLRAILSRYPELPEPPADVDWRANLGLRGLNRLSLPGLAGS
jgi:cytochrome P450